MWGRNRLTRDLELRGLDFEKSIAHDRETELLLLIAHKRGKKPKIDATTKTTGRNDSFLSLNVSCSVEQRIN